MREKVYTNLRRFQHHRDSLVLLSAGGRLSYFEARFKKVVLKYRRRVRDKYKKAVRSLYTRIGGTGAIPKKYLQIEDQIWKAGQNYVPSQYSGNVTLFLATSQPLGIVPDQTLGWGKYVSGEIEIHEVPGHHGSIVSEPFVRVLAEKLEKCIERTMEVSTETRMEVDSKNSASTRFEAAHV